MGREPITSKEIVRRFKEVHGDRYDYSRVEYRGSKIKVEVICKAHGSWLITPSNHKNGRGCPNCKSLLTQDQFLEKAKAKHGDRYDYTQSVYVHSQTKVKIGCSEHGIFEQTPFSHLQGQGCPVCGRRDANNNIALTTKKFVERAKQVHGSVYDYSLVNYSRNDAKVRIICPVHGEYSQTPHQHLRGIGCSRCGYIQSGKDRTREWDLVLQQFREAHGTRYQYDKSNYENSKSKIVLKRSQKT